MALRDFSRLTYFLNSVEFQAIKAKKDEMSDEDLVLAARSLWDAQIRPEDLPLPEYADWPEITMEGTAIAWDDGQYVATFEKGNIILRDDLTDLNIHLPIDTFNDEPFIVEEGQNDIDDYFVLTGVPYDDEVFVFDITP